MSKKIILIGGLRFSGTTVLDLILGNDERGFSGGEISSYFRSRRKLNCSCNEDPCLVWEGIKAGGIRNAYNSIFSRFPEVGFIVDSSKHPLWLSRQNSIAEGQGYDVRRLLIWKSPIESASSFYKRGQLDQWADAWVRYHRLYLSVVKDFSSISFRHFIEDETAIPQLCEKLEIPFFANKSEYWNKLHHSVGGNGSAKIHLHDKDSSTYGKISDFMKNRSSDLDQRYRSIASATVAPEVLEYVEKCMRERPEMAAIIEILQSFDYQGSRPALTAAEKREMNIPRSSQMIFRKIYSTLRFELDNLSSSRRRIVNQE